MSKTHARRRALVCAPLPPEYDRESGSRRIYHLIEILVGEGWDVAFICENAPSGSRHLAHLRQMGVLAHVGFDGRAADLISVARFDVAVFAFWHLADRHAHLVRRLSPSTRVVAESVDLHWLRNARRIFGGAGGSPQLLDASFGTEMVAELNAYRQADAVLTVSEKEAAIINDIAGDPRLAHAVPDCDDTPPSTVGVDDRSGMLFIGNFRHPPNLDAVAYLCEEVLPLVPDRIRRAHPLTIVGNGLDDRVRAHTDGLEHVRLVGWVPSLVPYLHRTRITVSPLRYGAGTKRKLIQALLARAPSVTTSVGVEGLSIRDGDHALVADDPMTFAAAIERLIDDPGLWDRLASKGRRHMVRRHGPGVMRRGLVAVLNDLLARPVAERCLVGDVDVPDPYASAAEGVRDAVERVIPGQAPVLVVSKGDPELVRLPGRTARHFPEAANGHYAGHHPADSGDAVRRLDAVPDRPDFLVIPSPSLWWLDHYPGFARHLAETHERVWSDDSCQIYKRSVRLEGTQRHAPPSVARAAQRPRTEDTAPLRLWRDRAEREQV